MIRFVAVFLVALLVGCASSGVRVTDSQMSQFVEGKTTQQEVVAALGEPTGVTRNFDGTTTLIYTYAEARTRATTFIPIVGLFAGGVDTRSNSVAMSFDKAGVLTTYSSSASQTGTATGIAVDGGDPVKDQPRK